MTAWLMALARHVEMDLENKWWEEVMVNELLRKRGRVNRSLGQV